MAGDDPTPLPPSTHPALTVSNIKTFIPVMLELESSQYGSWAELFQIHARAFLVLDHIIPPTDPTAAPTVDKALWSRIDAIVLQWIYGTISNDLLHTIIEPGSTAQEAWDRLRELFQNNKNSRAVHLEHKFSTIAMADFPNATAYCQQLKMLADQLANVGAPVSNHRMVLRLVAGLPGEYRNVASQIQHKDPLPLFPVARSMLLLEEDTLNASAAIEASAMVAATNDTHDHRDNGNNNYHGGRGNRNNYRGKKGGGRGGGRGNSDHRGHGGRGKGGSVRGGGHGGHGGTPNQPQQQGWAQPQQLFFPWMQHWAPPCPYPTNHWARPSGPANQQAGILGPRPAQAFTAAGPSYCPTDIDHAMHTMSLHQPDPNWYMDTGATSHMTSNQGLQDGDASHEM
ncbi:uncharacterized protein [Spinacia oleracea]|uniref:Retrotransposon Copia-like N-terminal domain-containing protein n=1 Tax=Spinacia oleracea TaxID=3562 RepID=A0ABM3RAU4_SPIOL|nr:uncharacterized protein LOC130459477 [Spinacia oleracea]XP_056692742.1 uncharacterized protein LOC130467846 [Spinacia oleracea]